MVNEIKKLKKEVQETTIKHGSTTNVNTGIRIVLLFANGFIF